MMMTLTILTSVWRDISLSFSLGFFWKYTVFGSTGIQHLSLTKGHLNWKTRLTPLASLSTCKGQPWWNSWWNSSYTVRRKGRWAGFYVSFDGHESETDKSVAQDHTNLQPELSTLKELKFREDLTWSGLPGCIQRTQQFLQQPPHPTSQPWPGITQNSLFRKP